MNILLNGPPGSGKNEVANIIKRNLYIPTRELKFAEPLNNILAATLGLDMSKDFDRKEFLYFREKGKDIVIPDLDKTPRDILIAISEQYLKPLFGSDYFANIAAKKANETPSNVLNIFTDSGFQVECDSFVKQITKPYMVVQIERPGYTFENDSRESVFDPNSDSPTLVVKNTAGLEELETEVIHLIKIILLRLSQQEKNNEQK